VKQLFTLTFSLFGISAPWFSWVAAVVLVLWPAWAIFKLFTLSRRQEGICNKLILEIKELHTKYPLQGRLGLHAAAIDRLRQLFADIPFLVGKWNIFRASLLYSALPDEDDTQQVWLTESSAIVFPEDGFLGSDFNKRHFHAIPGIVTGIGLLMTFAAILVGLLDVRIIDNKVHGLENLIGGLSGKFISSVAALSAATVFLFLEKRVFHRLNGVRIALISEIDSLVPRRTESHILEEISCNIAEQTKAFRTFNSDLSLKLRNSFSESVGPTLERMVLAIDSLNKLADSSKAELLEAICQMNHLLKKSEETRQDSISGQVESLLSDLQKSLSESIGRMSREFSSSLTGTAQDQFKRVAETVGATAQVLEGMNVQFTNTQSALQDLIAQAKQSTESQLNNGTALVDRMVTVVGGTLAQMEEKITDLSLKMATTIEGTAEKSAEAAGGIISEVRALNEQTVEKFVAVFRKHEEQLDRVDLLKQTLQEALAEFGEYVTGYDEINRELKSAARDINSNLQLLSQSSQRMKAVQESYNKIAVLAADKIHLLAESNEKQREIWKEINESMDSYKTTFQTVQVGASSVLSMITEHLQKFSRATQDHLDKTVTVANDHVNKAVNLLGGQIEELGEALVDLSEIVEEINRYRNNLRR